MNQKMETEIETETEIKTGTKIKIIKICKYCGKNKNSGHHCSGKDAYEKGRADALKEIYQNG